MKTIAFVCAFFLTACVTINIYFPAAAAEKVADEIIKGIQSEPGESTDQSEPQSSIKVEPYRYRMLDAALELVISSAQAGEADLTVNTSEIRQLRAGMKKRFLSLNAFYEKGLIGIKANGFIAIHGEIPLRDRNKVSKLVAAENADRQRLYQAIANANGHPEWFSQIKATFAKRWISNAKSGWWYKTANGSWIQK